MTYKKGDLRRQLHAIELRLAGMTQSEVAAEVGVSDRMIRKYEANLRRGKPSVLARFPRVLTEEYKRATDERSRARLFSALANVACQSAKEAARRLRLEQIRELGGTATHDQRDELQDPEAVDDDHRPQWRPESVNRSSRVVARALEILAEASGGPRPVESDRSTP